MATLQLLMNENLFVRDPQETELGRKIIEESIRMIDELGFEKFTFKKLALKIDSTEASVYRYFENKHRLLVYLIAWYWNWLEYRIDFGTQNISDPRKKLQIALALVTEKKDRDPLFPEVDEEALYRIVIWESDKTYLTKQVDDDNREGLFRGFKSLCAKIASYITEINPAYKYPHSLISTVLQMAHQQLFYAEHLPSLTDIKKKKGNLQAQNEAFLGEMIFNTITPKK
ncbi:TetR/AcrR family transcriptional regulator [Fulvivirga sedimenti]|uniref:TetR/AcrR family transcriptional regulator n=1 Tax=Fulvivirga sedimenti TaxID=2879465 RepID=A0A9X1HQ50_9BACT|nr:TetR/AcrR family transcriptional regulator [Fulvivirga sedimenti]MCA6074738.1 TetR/AcrR family transcriptional regulator [Fulvivirga sedimenti]MCA6075915.1 TetR/AcrR family transcriptional regulator [Fulvivirga sedimenti]MCA6077043.1 TetR/AcrR family transcriptional regulator [Fulvivirga sedimenti]